MLLATVAAFALSTAAFAQTSGGQSGSGATGQSGSGTMGQSGSGGAGQPGSGTMGQPGSGTMGQSGSGAPGQPGSGTMGQGGGQMGQAGSGSGGLNPQQRTQFQTYIQRERIPETRMPSNFDVRVGVIVPPTVELRTFPSAVNVNTYRYVATDDYILVIEPSSRRVVEVIRR
jgi:hypothetical protein